MFFTPLDDSTRFYWKVPFPQRWTYWLVVVCNPSEKICARQNLDIFPKYRVTSEQEKMCKKPPVFVYRTVLVLWNDHLGICYCGYFDVTSRDFIPNIWRPKLLHDLNQYPWHWSTGTTQTKHGPMNKDNDGGGWGFPGLRNETYILDLDVIFPKHPVIFSADEKRVSFITSKTHGI